MKCQHLDSFCYVCGHQIIIKLKYKRIHKHKEKHLLTPELKRAYKLFFDEVDTSDEDFTPNSVCRKCYNELLRWLNGGTHNMKYCKPVNWINRPGDHDETGCYSCENYTFGLNANAEKKKIYKATATAILPVMAPADFVSPKPPSPDRTTGTTAATGVTYEDPFDFDYEPEKERHGPELISQMEMDFIVAVLGLSQRLAIFLTAFLKRRKLTQAGVNSTAYRKRQAEFQSLYTLSDDNSFAYCNDIKGLVLKMGMEYIANEWRLFIDGSVSSLKAVLLHISNRKPSIPLAIGIDMKESYETLKNIMEKIKYVENKWKICCDLKVINILQGIIEKGGFPKFFCFRCNWDSRSPLNQYQCNTWRPRGSVEQQIKENNLRNTPLIDNTQDILLPPLHIKLGIVKKFIEVAVVNCPNAFDYLKRVFPKRSDSKIKAGVLNGPDIRKLFKSNFESSLGEGNHYLAWIYLQRVCSKVLGGDRDAELEAKEWVEQMLYYFEKIGASMTLKLHFLHYHFEEFMAQLPTESDEQGERFHQTTMPMEKRYRGKKLDALLAEVCWWSHKINLYDMNEATEEERADDGEQSGDVPMDTVSSGSESDSDDSDDDLEPQMKRARVSSQEPSTSKE